MLLQSNATKGDVQTMQSVHRCEKLRGPVSSPSRMDDDKLNSQEAYLYEVAADVPQLDEFGPRNLAPRGAQEISALNATSRGKGLSDCRGETSGA